MSRLPTLLLAGLLTVCALPGLGEPAAKSAPLPDFFEIAMSDKILGGVVGRGPGAITVSIAATRDGEPGMTVQRKIETPEGPRDQTHSVRLQRGETIALYNDLQALLTLPVEKPAGCEDIYGLATSVTFRRKTGKEVLEWRNAMPSSCAAPPSESSVKPTDEQKQKFAELAARIREFALSKVPALPGEKSSRK